MDSTTQQWNIPEGTDVVGADGDKVGKVVAAQFDYIVVEKGFFFPTDYYIPTSAIANFDGDKVYLSVSKDEALNQSWDQEPTAYATGGTGIDTTAGTAATDVSMRNAGDTIRVPVHEEELTATKRPEEVRVDDATAATDPSTTGRTRRGTATDAGVTDRPFTEETTTGSNTAS